MSLGEIYTLGVRIQGDVSSLRAELTQGQALANDFAKTTADSLNRAALAMERAAQGMESGARRSSRATQQTAQTTRKTADAFDDYMRRATKANEEVARSSEQTSERTSSSFAGLGRTLGRLTGAAGMGLLAKQTWDAGIGFHEFTQNTEVALELFLGSQEAAKGFLADVLAFAKQTPYAFTDLTDQAKQLLTYGFEAKQVIPILTAVGDAATGMGTGAAGMDRITRALGQINTKGRLQSQELLQLSEAGINGLAILANQAGMTTIEYQKLIEKGLIPADEAIAGLTQGIREGTDGINGQTTAFGGLMEKIKASGGITATLDSTRSSFRNTAAAVTQELVPAYVDLLNVTQSSLGVVKQAAEGYNALPKPVQAAATAFAAAAIASRLLNLQARTTSAWTAFQGAMATARVQTDLLTMSVSRSRAMLIQGQVALGMVGSAARTVGSALLSAFGGPVGVAIAGATAAIAAFAAWQAEVAGKAAEFKATLSETGDATDETLTKVNEALTRDRQGWWERLLGKDPKTLVDEGKLIGASLEDLQGYIMGNEAAVQRVAELRKQYVDAVSGDKDAWRGRREQTRWLFAALDSEADGYARAAREAEALAAANGQTATAVDAMGAAVDRSNTYLRQFTEEQAKAIEQAQQAAEKAFSVDMGSLNLNIATEDDLATARERVEDATRRLRDAEEQRQETAKREKATAGDKVRAEESVADARKALEDATNQLAQTEERTDPVKQYQDKVNGIIKANETFLQDIQALAERGLNAVDLQEIINKGAEGTVDIRQALLGDPDMVEFANQARETLTAQAETIRAQAGVVETHLQDTGGELMGDLALGMKLAASANAEGTLQELADQLGASPQKIRIVGNQLGLEFVNAFSDALGFDVGLFFGAQQGTPGGGGKRARAYANGGIYPGYTPGRDIGFIGVSGGEAIMRPEWTRAVGPALVDRWNRIARTAGVDGVRAEMRRYMGGFANGGTVGSAPQVVTVPVTSTNEHYSPITIGTVVAADVDDFQRKALERRRRANIGGLR